MDIYNKLRHHLQKSITLHEVMAVCHISMICTLKIQSCIIDVVRKLKPFHDFSHNVCFYSQITTFKLKKMPKTMTSQPANIALISLSVLKLCFVVVSRQLNEPRWMKLMG